MPAVGGWEGLGLGDGPALAALYETTLAPFDASLASPDGGGDELGAPRPHKQARLESATPVPPPPAGAPAGTPLAGQAGRGVPSTHPPVGGAARRSPPGGVGTPATSKGEGDDDGDADADADADTATMLAMLAYVRRLGLRGALPSAREGLLVTLPPNTAAGAAAKEAAKFARRARVALRCANLGERPRNVAGQGARWRAAQAAEEAFMTVGGREGRGARAGSGGAAGDDDGATRRSGRARAAPTFFAQAAWGKAPGAGEGSDSETSSMVWSAGGPGGARADSPSRVARAARRAATRAGPTYQADLPEQRAKPSKDAPAADGTSAAMDAQERAWLSCRVLVPGDIGPPGAVAPLLGPAPPPTAPDALGDALIAASILQTEWAYATATGPAAVAAVTGVGMGGGAGPGKVGAAAADPASLSSAAGSPAPLPGPDAAPPIYPSTLAIPGGAGGKVATGLGLGTMGPPAAFGWTPADQAAFASALALVGRQVLVWGLPLPEDMRSVMASAGAGVGGAAGGIGAGAVPGGVGAPGGPTRARTPWECSDFYYNVWKTRSTPAARLWYLQAEASFADAAHAAAGGAGKGMVLPGWLAAAAGKVPGPPGAAKVPGSGGLSFAALHGEGERRYGQHVPAAAPQATIAAAGPPTAAEGGVGAGAATNKRSEAALEAQRKRRMREMAAWARECGRAAASTEFDRWSSRVRRYRRAARAIAVAHVAAVTGGRLASLAPDSDGGGGGGGGGGGAAM